MRLLISSLACVALLLPACATRSPVSNLLPLQVDGIWSRLHLPISEDVWWARWNDPLLEALVRQAQGNNPDAAVTAARVAQARAGENVAESARSPTMTVNAGTERRGTSGQLQAQEAQSGSPVRGVRNQLSLETRLAYELDWLGRNRISAQGALAQTAAAQYDAAAARIALTAAVVEAYADIALAGQHIELAGAQARVTADAEAAERKRMVAGLSNARSLRVREDAVVGAARGLADATRARKQAIDRLALLLGMPAHQFAEPLVNAALLGHPLSLQANQPANVIERRPDVQAAWQRLIAATSEAERVRLERYPRITLTAGAGLVSESLRRWLQRDALGWVLGAAGALPVLDGGRLKSQAEQALALSQEREADYRKTVLTALQEAESALVQFEFTNGELEQAATIARRREADERNARSELLAGRIGRIPLADAERAAIEARESFVSAQRAHLQSYVLLRRVLADVA